MTRVDFYILASASPKERVQFACRLAEKAFSRGHRIYIHACDPAAAGEMDQSLWTFRGGSFVPHEQIDAEDADADTPIHIGWGDDPGSHDDVLINLAPEVPLFFSRFERVAEIIAGDEQQKAAGRERFRFYRDRGYEMKTHSL